MREIRFELDPRVKKNGEQSIRVVFYITPRRKYYRTGISVSAKFSNNSKQRVKNGWAGSARINSFLTVLRSDMNNRIVNAVRDGGALSFKEFEELFDHRVNGSPQKLASNSSGNVVMLGRQWIDAMSPQLKYSTLQTKKTLLSHLENYSTKRLLVLTP